MPSKIQSILLGGIAAAIVGAIVGFVPVAGNCLGCLAYLLAGLVAVWHYTDTYELTISGGSGAGMGAGAGLVAGLVSFLVTLLLQAINVVPSYSEGLDEALASGQFPPGQAETVESFVGSPLFPIMIAVFFVIIGAILGAIGGAIGASVFKRGGDTPGGASDGGGRPVAGPQGPAPGPGGRAAAPESTTMDGPAEPTRTEPTPEPHGR